MWLPEDTELEEVEGKPCLLPLAFCLLPFFPLLPLASCLLPFAFLPPLAFPLPKPLPSRCVYGLSSSLQVLM
ncbi:MAG: hypothetical protein EA395_08225 [Phormidium sp. GEM2.Bin31]|nr:MAG: hypothetical protein EA395_08225 [Phormidium sp. GEM2.Bin31]